MTEKKDSSTKDSEIKSKVEQAFNTGGFSAFVKKAGEIDPEDQRTIQLFERFKTKNQVSEGIKNIYKEKISDLLGIRLDNNELRSIDDHIETIAVDNPNRLNEMKDGLEKFKKLDGEVKVLQKEFKNLAVNTSKKDETYVSAVDVGKIDIDALTKDASTLEKAKKYLGIFGGIRSLFYKKSSKPAKEGLNEEFGPIDKNTAVGLLENIKKQINVGGELNDVRTNLFDEVQEITNLVEIIQQKLAAKLAIKLEDNEKAVREKRDEFNQVKALENDLNSEISIEYTKKLDPNFESEIEKTLKERISSSVLEYISRLDTSKNSAFTSFFKTIEKHIPKDSSDTTKNENINFVIEILRNSVDDLADDPSAKIPHINQAIRKLEDLKTKQN